LPTEGIGARSSLGLADLAVFGQARKAAGDGDGDQRAVYLALLEVGEDEAVELAGGQTGSKVTASITVSSGGGSSESVPVEAAGIEPASLVVVRRLLQV
jgi:hypothetical protein